MNKRWTAMGALALMLAVSAQANYTVTYPNGGETLVVGDTIVILWSNTEDEFQAHVELTVDDGISSVELYKQSIKRYTDTALWGHFQWVIPDSVHGVSTVSSQCRILMRPYLANPDANDLSDAVFTIKPRGWTPPPVEEPKKGGCGSGAGLAFIPPVLFRLAGRRKKKPMP